MDKVTTHISNFITLFLFIYFALYTSSCQFFLKLLFEPFWQIVTPKFAKFVGHKTPITVYPNGSGDTTYNYYKVLLILISAFVLAILIRSFFKKYISAGKLESCLIIILRYYIAFQMINYGLYKIFCLQFSFPSAAKLEQELGDFSPMGLLWAFMGYSKGYTIFTGTLEFLGGIFLLSRRTLNLGALLTFGVMLNVLMLNYCYDVPVKLFTTHLVIMAIYLISTDINRIFNFFFNDRYTKRVTRENILPEEFFRVKQLIKWIVIFLYLLYSLSQVKVMKKIRGTNSPKEIFDGKYNVEQVDLKPNRQDNINSTNINISDWQSIIQSRKGSVTIITKLNEKKHFDLHVDTTKKSIKIIIPSSHKFVAYNYKLLNNNRYKLYGSNNGDSVNVILKKEDLSEKRLLKRKFNWINEFPYNR